jgi:cell fate (sporulation/competence/biofilm development) regulator YmcA (YheA/YmcA/DUF963 family)
MTFLSSINSNPPHQKVSAHIFTPDETASFVAFADQLRIESELVQTNLLNNNLSLAQKHANKAASLLTPIISIEIAEENQRASDDLEAAINDLQKISSSSEEQRQRVNQLVQNINATLSEAVTKRIEQGQGQDSSNFLEKGIEFLRGIFGSANGGGEIDDNIDRGSRIKPLAFADLVDSILINYGNAYSVDFDMTDMSNMVMIGENSSTPMGGMATNGDNNNSSTNTSSMNMSSALMNTDSKVSKNYSLVNITDFQSAEALAATVLEIFDTELRPIVPKNETGFVGNLEGGLTQLNDLIRNKASPMDIMMVVHTQIHPSLLEVFNLQLR